MAHNISSPSYGRRYFRCRTLREEIENPNYPTRFGFVRVQDESMNQGTPAERSYEMAHSTQLKRKVPDSDQELADTSRGNKRVKLAESEESSPIIYECCPISVESAFQELFAHCALETERKAKSVLTSQVDRLAEQLAGLKIERDTGVLEKEQTSADYTEKEAKLIKSHDEQKQQMQTRHEEEVRQFRHKESQWSKQASENSVTIEDLKTLLGTTRTELDHKDQELASERNIHANAMQQLKQNLTQVSDERSNVVQQAQFMENGLRQDLEHAQHTSIDLETKITRLANHNEALMQELHGRANESADKDLVIIQKSDEIAELSIKLGEAQDINTHMATQKDEYDQKLTQVEQECLEHSKKLAEAEKRMTQMQQELEKLYNGQEAFKERALVGGVPIFNGKQTPAISVMDPTRSTDRTLQTTPNRQPVGSSERTSAQLPTPPESVDSKAQQKKSQSFKNRSGKKEPSIFLKPASGGVSKTKAPSRNTDSGLKRLAAEGPKRIGDGDSSHREYAARMKAVLQAAEARHSTQMGDAELFAHLKKVAKDNYVARHRKRFMYTESEMARSNDDYERGDYEKVRHNHLYRNDDNTEWLLFTKSDGRDTVRSSLYPIQLDINNKNVHVLKYPGTAQLTDHYNLNVYACRCMLAQIPELQAEAAGAFLSPEELSKFKLRAFGRDGDITTPREKDGMTKFWNSVKEELAAYQPFREACHLWIAGEEATGKHRCWPPTFVNVDKPTTSAESDAAIDALTEKANKALDVKKWNMDDELDKLLENVTGSMTNVDLNAKPVEDDGDGDEEQL